VVYMNKLACLGIVALLMSGSAYAADEMDLGNSRAAPKDGAFRYSATMEEYSLDGVKEKANWFGVQSGHLSGAITDKADAYKLRANATLDEVLGLQKAAGAPSWMKEIQVEAGAQTNHAPYTLVSKESKLMDNVGVDLGAVAAPGGDFRLFAGPAFHYGKSMTSVTYFPRSTQSASDVEHTLVMKNRFRDLGNDMVWMDVDASYKMVDDASDYGYAATIGVWKGYAKYAVQPLYEGTQVTKTSYEVGIDAAF
jgi:hypothetical protein